ncbi:MAG: MBL fold metallo-hydrolase [Candidatus Gastranaerophilales bacterium]
MIVEQIVVGQLENNIFLVVDEKTKKAVLIDGTADVVEIADKVKLHQADIEYVLLTHGHFDHVMGVNALKKTFDAEALIHKGDLLISDNINEYGSLFGLGECDIPKYEGFFEDNQTIKVGEMEIKVIHTPGHTEGGACFLIENQLFSGDTLFRDCIGRTDLFGGNYNKLANSIKTKLFTLDENILVHCGHGPSTSIAYEKKYNKHV